MTMNAEQKADLQRRIAEGQANKGIAPVKKEAAKVPPRKMTDYHSEQGYSIEQILDAAERHGGLTPISGKVNEWMALCPGHDDHNPSLHITHAADDGKVLVYCLSQKCDYFDILAGWGLSSNGSTPKEPELPVAVQLAQRKAAEEAANATEVGVTITAYDYKWLDGEVLNRKYKKEYTLEHAMAEGTHIPYNLQKLYERYKECQSSGDDLDIAVLEGEKCVDAFQDNFGDMAVAISFGTKNSDTHNDTIAILNTLLEGIQANFYIIPDHDALETGYKWAKRIEKDVKHKSVRVIRLPGLDNKEDIVEWIGKGGTLDDLLALVNDSKPYKSGWELKTVRPDFIYQPKYLAGDLCAEGWIVVFYGSPKCLKSMLVQDMVACMAAGKPWLEPLENDDKLKALEVQQSKILYLDFDNGDEVLEGHLAAILRGHDNPPAAYENLLFESHPDNPIFSALDEDSVQYIIQLIQKEGIEVLVIDHLLNASGMDDENISKMSKAMANLRRIIKETGVLIIAIAHTPKNGTSIRGHGSITDGADMTYLVEREANADKITVTCTNPRHYPPAPFSAVFEYDSLAEDRRILKTGRMALIPFEEVKESKTREKANGPAPSETVSTWMWENHDKLVGMNTTQARDYMAEATGIGGNACLAAIQKAVNDKLLTKEKQGKSQILRPGERFDTSKMSSQVQDRLRELKKVGEQE